MVATVKLEGDVGYDHTVHHLAMVATAKLEEMLVADRCGPPSGDGGYE